MGKLTRVNNHVQYLMVKELYTLSDRAQRSRHNHRVVGDKRKAPRWYFFFVATFWMYFRCVAFLPSACQSPCDPLLAAALQFVPSS